VYDGCSVPHQQVEVFSVLARDYERVAIKRGDPQAFDQREYVFEGGGDLGL
jgi:hypothetical protein